MRDHMRLKIAAFIFLIPFISCSFAKNERHFLENQPENPSVSSTKASYADFCEIEIFNHSDEDVRVSGFLDNGVPLEPFTIYSYDQPYYISLYYYGHCHRGMNLMIESYFGYPIYQEYTRRQTTIRIVSSFMKEKARAVVVQH